MKIFSRYGKRIVTDAAGYGLILLSLALGWLPGPGGIPLLVAGLGLLSINNAWAERLRTYLFQHGGKVVTIIFPPIPLIQWLYDGFVVLLLSLVSLLVYRHQAAWQISLAIAGFFVALAIGFLNRGRYERIKRKHQ